VSAVRVTQSREDSVADALVPRREGKLCGCCCSSQLPGLPGVAPELFFIIFLGLKSNDSRQYSVASTNYPLTAVVHHNSPQPTPTHPHDYGVSTHARAY
jgi:hypothetical protein